MKTKLYLTLWWCLFTTFSAISQTVSCDTPLAEPQQMELLDYKFLMHRDGNLWTFFRNEVEPWYISIGGLWMGAFTPDGNLRIAGYDHSGIEIPGDFWPGPLQENGNPKLEWCPLFDRIWKISKTQIQAFVADWEDNNQFDNPIPEVILSWPGSGNPYYLQNYWISLPIDDLAPFFDRNGNKMYEPLQGDFPIIKGDLALWKMVNDNAGPHIETMGLPLKVQTRIMAYAFDSNDPALSNTVFYNVSIKNRNPDTLKQFKTGIWMDHKWSCHSWERWMVRADKNLAYFFNLFAPGDSCFNDPLNLTPQWNYWHGLKLLQSPEEKDSVYQSQLSGVVYFRNSAYNNPPVNTINPLVDIEYYRYLSNYWRDGSPFTFGGDGYQTGSPFPFVFPDALTDSTGWSACTTEWPNYTLYSLFNFPLGDFAPGEKKTFDLAFFRIPAPQNLCANSDPLLWPDDQIQEFWENEVVAVSDLPAPLSPVHIFPNPSRGFFTIQGLSNFSWKISNLQGMTIAEDATPSISAKISTDGWTPGLYFVEVELTSGKRVVKKVVVH